MTDPTPSASIDPAERETDELIAAAEKHAEAYDGDDRPCIKTDVLNAFFRGSTYEKRRAARLSSSPQGGAEPVGKVDSEGHATFFDPIPEGGALLFAAHPVRESPAVAAPPEPALDSHGRYWVEHRCRILDAITRAWFRLLSDKDGFWLSRLPSESAAPAVAAPQPAPMTKEWCRDYPGSAAYIINELARQVDASQGAPEQ